MTGGRAAQASLVALTLLLCACDERPPSFAPPPMRAAKKPLAFTPPAGLQALRLGLVPYLERETMLRTHRPLAAYLGGQLHVPVELEVADSYGDALQRFRRGEYDVVELSPLSYARLNTARDVDCVAQSISDGSETGSGYIVVRDDSPVQSIADLKGKRLGLVDPMSTSGGLFPRKVFRDQGLDVRRDFASVEYLGNHEAVLLAVLDGGVDVGATYQGSFGALWRSRAINPLSFRVIAKTPRVPRDIYCVRPGLPKEVAEAFGEALLGISTRDREGRQVLSPLNLNGFVPPKDEAYDGVRSIAKEIDE